MIELGLDMSLRGTAWCVMCSNKGIIDIGMVRTHDINTKAKPIKGVTVVDGVEQCGNYIADELLMVAVRYQPTGVIRENFSFGSMGNATRDLAFAAGFIMRALTKQSRTLTGNDTLTVTPMSLKKHARLETGVNTSLKGNTGKDAMIEAIGVKFGEDVLSSYTKTGINGGKGDLADAIWCADYGLKMRS